MINLYGKVGECKPDGLIIDTLPHLRTGSVTIEAGAGELKRGAIIAKDSNGNFNLLGKAVEKNAKEAAEGDAQQTTQENAEETTAKPYGILTDDINITEATVATVYLSGCFNANKVYAAEGYTVTDEDKDVLRTYGIELRTAQEY